jgi:hypothetical protein
MYILLKFKTMTKEIECPNCEGTGIIEVRATCTVQPWSECCGGCMEDVECEECNGTGTIEEDEEE